MSEHRIFDDVEDWILRRRQTSAAQAAATTTKGTTMSPFDSLKGFIADVEAIGPEVLDRTKRIAANPYTLPALEWLDTLSGGHIPADVLVKTLGAIEGLHLAYPKPGPADNGQQAAGGTQQ